MDQKKISQKDLVEDLGFHKSQVSKWLADKTAKPRRATLHKLADFFGCSIDWLADGVGEPFPKDGKSLSIVGNGNIQAGRGGVKISGGAKVNTSDNHQDAPFVLDEEEMQFIALIREVGGKQALRKFRAELLRLRQIIDKELE